MEEQDRRWHKWGELSKGERRSMIHDELLESPLLTAREIAERLEDGDMKVWPDSIRPLVREMFDEGSLAREEERYGRGSRIRFRYSVTEAEAA